MDTYQPIYGTTNGMLWRNIEYRDKFEILTFYAQVEPKRY
jgi:hypothetical protein